MDLFSIIGVIGAFAVLIVATIIKGIGPAALVGAEPFIVVICGTLCATLVQTPSITFKHAMHMGLWVFRPPQDDAKAMIARIVEWSTAARKQGLLALEASVESETDPFIKQGLQALVDGAEPDMIRAVMEVDMVTKEHFDLQGAKVFEGMGIYAPTMGIVGAVLGLMSVMKNLTNPSELGEGIAAAFVATVYGIASANLILLPMATKLKAIVNGQAHTREMIIEGLISISRGENPRNIEAKLAGFLH
ncbi:MAG: flagellar motor protein [Stenotrophobium sp.]